MVQFYNYKGSGLTGSDLYPVKLEKVTYETDSSRWRLQFPLRLNYARNVHKVQGLTLDRVVLNLPHSEFVFGETYVAVSRVRSIRGLAIRSFDASRLVCNKMSTRGVFMAEKLRLQRMSDKFAATF